MKRDWEERGKGEGGRERERESSPPMRASRPLGNLLARWLGRGDDGWEALEQMRQGYAAGAWRILPDYPYGHALIAAHEPLSALWPVLYLTAATALMHWLVRRAAIAAGRALVTRDRVHTVDWPRFGDIVYFTCYHVVLTSYFALFLRTEAAGWLTDRQQFWEFLQPALSPALWWYYVIELALTSESCLHLLYRLARDPTNRDTPMLIHHMSTM